MHRSGSAPWTSSNARSAKATVGARDKLRELQRDLTEAEQSGKLPPELTREALQQINAIAAAYGIELER